MIDERTKAFAMVAAMVVSVALALGIGTITAPYPNYGCMDVRPSSDGQGVAVSCPADEMAIRVVGMTVETWCACP